MKNPTKQQLKLEHVELQFSLFQFINPKLNNIKNERSQAFEGLPKVDLQLQAKKCTNNLCLILFR